MKTNSNRILLVLLFLSACPVFGDIIYPSNRVAWVPGVTVGVRGGIPARPTIYATMPPTATLAQINSALANCPTNQTVLLSAGTYTITSPITFTKSGVTLRGAGLGRTRIYNSAGGAAVNITGNGWDNYSLVGSVTGGYTKGSTNLVLTSASGLTPGAMVVLTQSNDVAFVWRRYGAGGNILEVLNHRFEVQAVNGNTVTVWPPLPITYSIGWNLRLRRNVGTFYSGCGIEDMTVEGTGPNYNNINLYLARDCWVKNVESFKANQHHFLVTRCMFVEIRDCWLHNQAGGQDGYGVETFATATGLLIENNIFSQLWFGTIMDGTHHCVVSYNCFTNSTQTSASTDQVGMCNTGHGMEHAVMNLYEGNTSEALQADNYHGSTGHIIMYRNNFHGLHPTLTRNRKMIDLVTYAYYCSAVGNVLGFPGLDRVNGAYEMTQSGWTGVYPVIYRLGYPNMGNNMYSGTGAPAPGSSPYGLDTKVKSTFYRHGNYDYHSQSTIWDSANPDHTIPSSLYLTSKPPWWDNFGATPWPPIGPDRSPMVSALPAQLRFAAGVPNPGAPRIPTSFRQTGATNAP